MFVVCTTIYEKYKLVDTEKLIPRHSAYAIIIRNRKILLIKTRTTGKYWFPGGTMDGNEKIEQALEREVMEECGIEVSNIKPFLDTESYFYYDHTDQAFHQFSHFYTCKAQGLEVTDAKNPDAKDEAVEPAWIDLDTLSEDDFHSFAGEVFKLLMHNGGE